MTTYRTYIRDNAPEKKAGTSRGKRIALIVGLLVLLAVGITWWVWARAFTSPIVRFLEHYREILTDPAHLAVELTMMVIVDVLILGVMVPLVQRRIDRRVYREHEKIDAEHGIDHDTAIAQRGTGVGLSRFSDEDLFALRDMAVDELDRRQMAGGGVRG